MRPSKTFLNSAITSIQRLAKQLQIFSDISEQYKTYINNLNTNFSELKELLHVHKSSEDKLHNDNLLLKAEKGLLKRKTRRRAA